MRDTVSRMTRLGELLRLYRATHGVVGVRALARDIGISSATLSRIERGKAFDLHTWNKLVHWLVQK